MEAMPRALPWRASATSSSATCFEVMVLVTKRRDRADQAWSAVCREEERVVAAKVPPSAMRSATWLVKMEVSPPFASTAK